MTPSPLSESTVAISSAEPSTENFHTQLRYCTSVHVGDGEGGIGVGIGSAAAMRAAAVGAGVRGVAGAGVAVGVTLAAAVGVGVRLGVGRGVGVDVNERARRNVVGAGTVLDPSTLFSVPPIKTKATEATSGTSRPPQNASPFNFHGSAQKWCQPSTIL
jgi:hypothetical protein